jgi:adenylate cyclase class 2
MPQQLETEVKFYIGNSEKFRERIVKFGGHSKGRFFERNVCYEDRDKTLIRHSSLLRLRTGATTLLTFKSIPPEVDEDYKIMNEIEVEVSDAEKMDRILNHLGFHREQVYEKWREIFATEGCEICLDSLPFGDFVEIEGHKNAIQHLARSLHLPWEKRIVAGYLAIFEAIRTKRQFSFTDITFENFKNVLRPLDECIQPFEKKNHIEERSS